MHEQRPDETLIWAFVRNVGATSLGACWAVIAPLTPHIEGLVHKWSAIIVIALFAMAIGFVAGAATGYAALDAVLARPHRSIVLAFAGLSGLLAITSSAQSTGSSVVDSAQLAVVAAVVTAAGSKARRLPLLVASVFLGAATLLGAFAGGATWISIALAFVTLGGALALRLEPRRIRYANMLVAGGVANSAVRLPTSLPTYIPSVVAMTAFVMILAAAYSQLHRHGRRRSARAGLIGLGITSIGVVAGIGAVAETRADVELGVKNIKQGLAKAEAIDTEGALQAFVAARDSLGKAEAKSSVWWAKPGLLVPALSQNMRAVEMLTGVGAKLAESAATLTEASDPTELRKLNGSIDLKALELLAASLRESNLSISDSLVALSSVDAPWIAPPLRAKVKPLIADVVNAQTRVRTGLRVADVLPAMLGADRPKRYLLVAPTPAEARGGGGVIGNLGEVEIVAGKFGSLKFERIIPLSAKGVPWKQRTVPDLPDYMRRYADFDVRQYPQNSLASPDFPSDAIVLAAQYPQAGGRDVDGVISIDPFGLAAILELVGPVTVKNWPEPISSSNATKVLLNESYVRFDNALDGRIELLSEVTNAAWQKLLSVPFPSPSRIGDVLGPVVRERHIQIWMKDPAAQAYITEIGADGAVPPLVSDGIGIVGQNGSPNKIDYYSRRNINYNMTIDAQGNAEGTATVTLKNDAPGEGLPDYVIGNLITNRKLVRGTATTRLSFYSALKLESLTIDGDRPWPGVPDTEFGRNVYTSWVDIGPGASRVLVYELKGKVPLINGAYRLDVLHQPTVNNDVLTFDITTPGGWVTPKVLPFTTKGDTISGTLELKQHTAIVLQRKS